jgi:hypothetical protein
MVESCSNCYFGKEINEKEIAGLKINAIYSTPCWCRRLPPKPVDRKTFARYPIVAPFWWCGKWSAPQI